jgi:8-oxo-dGTP pyrophosphatase MutT (NUDIX family)
MVYRERSGQTRWELPSGIMQKSETFEDTAARETCEETGVQIQIGAQLCTVVMHVPAAEYRGINVYFHGTAVGASVPTAPLDEPIRQVEFVDVAALRPRDIHPVDRQILRRWRRNPARTPFCFQITL